MGQVGLVKPRCKGCAFTPGTPANQDRMTVLKTELCVMAYEPFYCHANAVDDQLPEDRKMLCAGWCEAVAGKDYPPDWKRRMAAACLKEIADAEDGKEYDSDKVTRAILQAAMEAS